MMSSDAVIKVIGGNYNSVPENLITDSRLGALAVRIGAYLSGKRRGDDDVSIEEIRRKTFCGRDGWQKARRQLLAAGYLVENRVRQADGGFSAPFFLFNPAGEEIWSQRAGTGSAGAGKAGAGKTGAGESGPGQRARANRARVREGVPAHGIGINTGMVINKTNTAREAGGPSEPSPSLGQLVAQELGEGVGALFSPDDLAEISVVASGALHGQLRSAAIAIAAAIRDGRAKNPKRYAVGLARRARMGLVGCPQSSPLPAGKNGKEDPFRGLEDGTVVCHKGEQLRLLGRVWQGPRGAYVGRDAEAIATIARAAQESREGACV